MFVSAGELAGAGPIEATTHRPPHSTGRAGVCVSISTKRRSSIENSRHAKKLQSLALRAVASWFAKKSIKCHTYYRGLAAVEDPEDLPQVDQQCRISQTFQSEWFQVVSVVSYGVAKVLDASSPTFEIYRVHRHFSIRHLSKTVADMTRHLLGFLKVGFMGRGEAAS